jgi:hypothetical protein
MKETTMANHQINPCAGCGTDMGPTAFDDFCDLCRLEGNVPTVYPCCDSEGCSLCGGGGIYDPHPPLRSAKCSRRRTGRSC